MAVLNYETRRALSEKIAKEFAKRGKNLSRSEKKLLPDSSYYTIPAEVCNEMRQLLQHGTYRKLSDLYRGQFQQVVDVCVGAEHQVDFYHALDEMNCYQMTAGWFRRSLRSASYIPFVEDSVRLLRAYAHLDYYGGNLADVLTGKVSEEYYDHARSEAFDYAWILAAQIDRGEARTIQAIRDILFGESNTLMMSRELVLGIVMSKSQELYADLGKFLLAARLQEGARQVVCETMDAGRPEAFLHLFSVIEENNLIRYSSVKRAISTWIGIFDENSVDRITEKLLTMMGQCLRDAEYRERALSSNDAIAISCALWAKGFYNADEAVEAILSLVHSGTKQQMMTASYFCRSLQNEKKQMRAAKEVLLAHPEDLELAACFMPCLMRPDFFALLRDKIGYGFDLRSEKVRAPKPLEPKDLFQSREEAQKIYALLKGIMERLPKKGLKLSPCIFPWYAVELGVSDIAERMCLIAWMLHEDVYLDEAAGLIPLIGQGQAYNASRAAAARVLLYQPKSQARKRVLFDLLHNPEEFTNKCAHKLVEAMELTAEDYIEIEQNMKYKKGRAETLALLCRQKGDQLAGCVKRLLADKSEECRMGALDIALQLKKEDKKTFLKVLPDLQALPNPTGREKVLLKELIGERSEAQDILKKPGFGLYDTTKDWVLPQVKLDAGGADRLFVYGEKACIEVLKKLDCLIGENREREYRTAWGEEQLLGSRLAVKEWVSGQAEKEPLDCYPFRELWEAFYEKEIKTPQLMLEVRLYCQCYEDRNNYEKNKKFYQQVFSSAFSNLLVVFTYREQVETAVEMLFDQYVPRTLRMQFGLCAGAKVLSITDPSNALLSSEQNQGSGQYHTGFAGHVLGLPVFRDMWQWLCDTAEEDWERSFALRFALQRYCDNPDAEKRRLQRVECNEYYRFCREHNVALSDYVQCYVRGIWDKDLFYKAVFSYCGIAILLRPISIVEQKGAVSVQSVGYNGLDDFFGSNVIKPVDGKYRFDVVRDTLPEMAFAHELYQEVIPLILKVELKRGEQPTPFSSVIGNIQAVCGIDYMIQILTALGKDPLQRGYSYYTAATDRRQVLSHLLKVSMPDPGETADDLRRALVGTDIREKRLVELAMYAQQWIPLVEAYLEMPGFASTCYYFMAHTSEQFDERVTSVIARYTPLSTEELQDGAFDIHWFFEAYNRLGEKNFKMLYDAAKYSSGGTAHGRARKYADAALGRLDKEEMKAQISAKRNKDLLMGIGLLPLPELPATREEELLDRYRFIQNFKKESRQFGAQRRASEGRAAEIALRNLGVNAGFTDVMRLTLRMEGKLAAQSTEFFEWRAVGEIELMVLVDENGKSTLQCRKDGKLLKSVPAKYKKDETVLQYQAVVKGLKEQYSRTRQMLEQAMEDRTAFEVWEFLELYHNPVVSPVARTLVVRTVEEQDTKLGFLAQEGIVDCFGTVVPMKPDGQIFIAHPYDLYRSGHWHDYQKLLFDKQIRQPFKQVFRELYVKLDDELDKLHSLLFAGNQIQPQKTVGVLRGRRWVADYEEGLQKIYYKEDIIACIYAMADWFSPSDVEAPTLEHVVFYDRKTWKQLCIRDIPDIIYSEVMRDVDLAVSVAHAGGVDPETSHSTIEMRRAVAECSLALFGTKNVRFEGSHALIDGKLGQYSVHLGSGVVHQVGNAMLFVVPVHAQQRGRIFLPFVDDDPKTAEVVSKILLFAEDTKIKDPKILQQIQ